MIDCRSSKWTTPTSKRGRNWGAKTTPQQVYVAGANSQLIAPPAVIQKASHDGYPVAILPSRRSLP